MHPNKTFILTAAAATGLAAAGASADLVYYAATLDPLNGSNVSGRANLVHDTDAETLTVNIVAVNLEPGQVHPQHIHGRFDGPDLLTGNPIDSVTPGPEQDADGDGFIELAEGFSSYGPVILPLSQPPAEGDDPATLSFPTPDTPVLNFTQVYDLSDEGQFFFPMMPPAQGGPDYDGDDLFPLNFREIVLHGMTVPTGPGLGTPGEVDGSGGYTPTLPVAAGEIVGFPIPEPTAAALAVGATGLLCLRRRR